MDITFNIFTNCCLSTPSIKLMKMMIESLEDSFNIKIKNYPVNIFIDPNPYLDRYDSYLNNIKKYINSKNILCFFYKTEGLSYSYYKSIEVSKTKVLFQIEHDWYFVKKRIKHKLSDIVNILNDNDQIKHIRFNKRNNINSKSDGIITEIKVNNISLCKTRFPSNNPHICKLSEMIKRKEYIKLQQGAKGIEENFISCREGFLRTGNYIYMGLNYPRTISHTNGKFTE